MAPSPAAVFPATTCPAALGKLQDVAAPAHPGTQLLGSESRPSTALVCEYRSTFATGTRPRHTLAKQLRLAVAPANELAAAARIDVGTSDDAAGCPADSGDVTVIAFGYRDAPPVDLWWQSTGCQTLDNGAAEAVQVGNDSFGDFQTTFADVTRAST